MAQHAGGPQQKKLVILLCTSRAVGWGDVREILREWNVVKKIIQVRESDDPVSSVVTSHPDVIIVAADRSEQPVVSLVAQLHRARPQSIIVVIGKPVGGGGIIRVLRLAGAMAHLGWDGMCPERIHGCIYSGISQGTPRHSLRLTQCMIRQRPAVRGMCRCSRFHAAWNGALICKLGQGQDRGDKWHHS